MEFAQYSYWHTHQYLVGRSASLPSSDLFAFSRKYSTSAIYEFHPINEGCIALFRTREQGGAICIHALCSLDTISPVTLLSNLSSRCFPTASDYNAWSASNRGDITLPERSLDITEMSSLPGFPSGCSESVMKRLLRRLWQLCDDRLHGFKNSGTTWLVLPSQYTLEDMAQFVAFQLLSKLPACLQSQFSVIFSCDKDKAIHFPQSTTCFVVNNAADAPPEAFCPFEGLPDTQTFGVSAALEKVIWQDNDIQPLYAQIVRDIPDKCKYDYSWANDLMDLCLLTQQDPQMSMHAQAWDPAFDSLAKRLSAVLNSSEVARARLLPLETSLFEQWMRIRNNNPTPKDLYETLVCKAISAPDDTLWHTYYSALSQPWNTDPNVSAVEFLMTACYPEDNESQAKRLAQICAALCKVDGSGSAALALVQDHVSECFLEESQACQLLCNHVSQYNISELVRILTFAKWSGDESSALLKAVQQQYNSALSATNSEDVEHSLHQLLISVKQHSACDHIVVALHSQLERILIEKIEQQPTVDRFNLLWGLQDEKPNKFGMSVLLACANNLKMTDSLASSLAQLTPKLLDLKCEELICSLMQLFTRQPHHGAMWQILECLGHCYDRQSWSAWAASEAAHITRKFDESLQELKDPVSLKTLQEYWQRLCQAYQYDWNCFPAHIPTAVQLVYNTVFRLLESQTDISTYYAVHQDFRYDNWYCNAIQTQLKCVIINRLNDILTSPDNRDMLSLSHLLELLTNLGLSELCQPNHPQADSRLVALQLSWTIGYQAHTLNVQQKMDHLNQLYLYYNQNPNSNVSFYACQCAESMLPRENFADKMLFCLMQHIDNPQAGWQAFFAQNEAYLPCKGMTPWSENHLCSLNMLQHVAYWLERLCADPIWRNELRNYLLNDKAWECVIAFMENDKAYARYIRSNNTSAPKLSKMLDLPC